MGYAKLFSPEIYPPPDNAIRLAAWRSFLIFHKNFCILYIQGKEKRKLFRCFEIIEIKEDNQCVIIEMKIYSVILSAEWIRRCRRS